MRRSLKPQVVDAVIYTTVAGWARVRPEPIVDFRSLVPARYRDHRPPWSLGTFLVVEDQELLMALRDLVVAAERERLRMAREALGVGVTEMQACAFIAANGPRTPSELADRLQMTTASVTELLDRLQREDLISRMPHPTDRRKLLITLTPNGAHKAEQAQERFGAIMARSATDLTPAERDVVLAFLRNAAAVISDNSATDSSSDQL